MLTVTVKGGYWGDFAGGNMTIRNEAPVKRRIAQMLDRPHMRGFRELMLTLNGAAAGGAALETHSRIKAAEEGGAIDSELGGLRTIETVEDVNRNTTSADETNIDETILDYPLQPTYVANGDGNPRGYPGG